ADADADGFGSPNYTVQACTAPAGYVDNTDDCDDLDATVGACDEEEDSGGDGKRALCATTSAPTAFGLLVGALGLTLTRRRRAV
ncbi:hypothetical protein L6R46_24995, partial [Myxococcota bacterium]|nr:hypothetical protein [Myxococcota bacterium]